MARSLLTNASSQPARLCFLQHSSDMLPCMWFLWEREMGEDAEAVLVKLAKQGWQVEWWGCLYTADWHSPALEEVAPLFNWLLSHDTPEWEPVPPAEIHSPSAPFRYAIQPYRLLIHSELVVLSYFQQIYICHTSPHFCKVKVCKFSWLISTLDLKILVKEENKWHFL